MLAPLVGSRTVDPLDTAVVSICMLEAGTASNVIPDRAVLRGTFRTHREAVQDRVEEGLRRIAAGVAHAGDVTIDVDITHGVCGTVNHPEAAALAAEVGEDAYERICWRQGTKGELASRFTAIRVKLTNVKLRSAHADGELPVRWLLAQWPEGKNAPTDFWISDLPDDTPIENLVALAKLRWRIEQDYRELKDALGLDHFEGRSWPGWHHHTTLVSVAHGFLTLERLRRPQRRAAA